MQAEDIRRETRAFLALCTIPGWGYWTLKAIAAAGLDFDHVLHLSDAELRPQLKLYGVRLPSIQSSWTATAELAWKNALTLQARLAKGATEVVLRRSSAFPRQLEDLEDVPEWLFVRGSLDVLHAPSLAVVGTRQPTADGLWLTRWLGEALPLIHAGATVSGLALGIDQAIHTASLVAGTPTIAVIGTGIFSEYPAGSGAFAERIIAHGGAIVTEYLPDDRYSRENFVRRNRLQAALGRVVVPVEWKIASGTAHTVGYAQALRRTLIGLKLRSSSSSQLELQDLRRRGAQVFELPGDETQLLSHLNDELAREPFLQAENESTTSRDTAEQLKLI